MVDFLLIFLINFLLIEIINNNSILIEQIIFFDYFYEFLFILFFLNFIYKRKEKFNFNLDILSKYYLFFFKKPNYLLNYLIIIFKKIYVFIFNFKYNFFISTNKIFFSIFFKKINLTWRPLFKKFSYFGFFRSNRSKWIK